MTDSPNTTDSTTAIAGPTTATATPVRTALVTGGARGIGAAVAARLARAGHRVAVLDRDGRGAAACAAELSGRGAHAVATECDVTDEASVADALGSVTDELGPVEILVNNAGVLRDDLLFRMSTPDWESVIDVHLKGAFLMSRAVQASMVEGRWGRIVNLSSTSATGNRGQANYSAAKAGIQGFTKTLALELGPFGITVNAVAPGFIETDMTRATAERMKIPYADFVSNAAASAAVRRTGQPSDVAHAIAFFACEESDFVSGQVLYVAGGPHG